MTYGVIYNPFFKLCMYANFVQVFFSKLKTQTLCYLELILHGEEMLNF